MRPSPNLRRRRHGPVLRTGRFVFALALSCALTAGAVAQQPAPQPGAGARPGPGAQSREATWPAPTAEDWKRPCLITWQRTWEDAQAVAKETGKPILVCVNMDGEIASEHYAGIRYRQPEIAALYAPYVCVIASVYRHTPADHDEQGRRIVCPRFGTVTCGEHINIEPGLFGQYFEGQRVAPRHIGVEPEGGGGPQGAEMFDVFYAWDTQTIFDTLRQGVEHRPLPELPQRGDLSLPELVASRDVEKRQQAEALYLAGDREQRRALLEAAIAKSDAAPIELLRLAVLGSDGELAGLARRALAQSPAPAATDVIIEALDLPMPASDQQALLDALMRLGEPTSRARTIAQARRGLAGGSQLDVEAWSAALEPRPDYRPAMPDPAAQARLAVQDELLASDDAAGLLELAEDLLELAEAEPDSESARWLYTDAQAAARRAESLGASGPHLNAIMAVAALSLGDEAEGRARVEAGVEGVAAVPRSRGAMRMLELFAQSRQAAIAQAVRDKREWPGQWLADVDAAYGVLVQHPDGTDAQAVMHYDFVSWFGAASKAEQILADGLARFPGSWDLHDRLRGSLLRRRGAAGLEAEYEARLAALAASPVPAGEGGPQAAAAALAELESFAGYASLVVAEFHRRGGDAEAARAAYDRAIGHYERSVAGDPSRRATADHFVALALAGRARVAYERGDDALALEELLSSFARDDQAAATPDGLNVTPADTARMLRARLRQQGAAEPLAVLDGALAELDPELLRLPGYERGTPGERPSETTPVTPPPAQP